ncbi:MAG: hypothetical protein M1823_006497, partial [Watsoniomyces obsoletus]
MGTELEWTRQKQSNDKNKALTQFELRDGQLWRQATGVELAKYVVCSYEGFERIKATHLQLEHAGTVKTYKALQARYYGISRGRGHMGRPAMSELF